MPTRLQLSDADRNDCVAPPTYPPSTPFFTSLLGIRYIHDHSRYILWHKEQSGFASSVTITTSECMNGSPALVLPSRYRLSISHACSSIFTGSLSWGGF